MADVLASKTNNTVLLSVSVSIVAIPMQKICGRKVMMPQILKVKVKVKLMKMMMKMKKLLKIKRQTNMIWMIHWMKTDQSFSYIENIYFYRFFCNIGGGAVV